MFKHTKNGDVQKSVRNNRTNLSAGRVVNYRGSEVFTALTPWFHSHDDSVNCETFAELRAAAVVRKGQTLHAGRCARRTIAC